MAAFFAYNKAQEVSTKIISRITGFGLKGVKRGAFWFSVRVAFDNHTAISIPLESVFVKVSYIQGNGERQEIATSKPATDKYVVQANKTTELNDILIAVPLFSLVGPLRMLLTTAGTSGTRQFEVTASAKAAGQTVTKTEIFQR